MKIIDLLTASDKKYPSKVFFAEELDRLYSPDYGYTPGEEIECFIIEAPAGLISGGKWIVYTGEFYKFFEKFRADLAAPVIRELRTIYGQEARAVCKAIREGKDSDFQCEISTALYKILDRLCYTWARKAAEKTGRKIAPAHY